MPRPVKCRFVRNFPGTTIFKPCGNQVDVIENNFLSVDELEALRLADFECKKHEEAAGIMGVSRATFGRIIEKARNTVADSLLNGKALIIKGGDFCHKRISMIEPGDGNVYQICTPTEKASRKCENCTRFNPKSSLEKEI